MAGRNCYESANQLAEYGDEIREYIQQLASAGTANATDNAVNVQTKEKLTRRMAKLRSSLPPLPPWPQRLPITGTWTPTVAPAQAAAAIV
jgi:hypothetical protein